MFQSNTEKEKLFSKSVSVKIKEGNKNQCRDSKLNFTVEWQHVPNAVHRQELLVTLTDNNDPFFLYHLQLSEEDFQMLKTSQGLLVDFSAFPQKFIALIEICLMEENKSQPKFLLVLNVSDKVGNFSSSQLDIIETNPFKHLTHLSLKFVAATDSSIRQYLALCFKNLKEENHQLHSRLTQLDRDFNEQVASSRNALEQKIQELEMVRKELSVEMSMKESKFTRELQEEKEKFLYKLKDEELRLEREKKEKDDAYRKEIQQLEARVSCLGTLNKELQDKNYKQENSIRDLRTQIITLEEETKRNKESLQSHKEKNSSLLSEIEEKRLRLVHQKKTIEELEKDITYKKQQIGRLEEKMEHYQKQEKTYEQELTEMKVKFQKSLRTCDQLEEDISKANEVINKLQREIQSGHERMKQKNLLLSKQELSVSEKDKIIQMLQKELKDLKLDLKRKSNEVKHLSDTVASLEEKTNHFEKELKARDSVIKYLNRQLTDRCILPQYVPPSNLISNPVNQAVKINFAGDAGILKTQPPPALDKPKILPTRNDRSPSHLEGEHNSPSQAPLDSAYVSSPSSIVNDENANVANFQFDSETMSAAFGTGEVLKHSTAKKSLSGKNKSAFRKK
ncbi:spindle assembly abnormal protein 6 homolog [Trichonephila clavata]|uniref:Spindle assembly abnormal protein 6 homolog n=1 Tax=Trichonephila clavata TaxID=2740835 RepID=A0A8X6HC10_TRICU|nr:spindle assembly abnormal protein 6 homolog [Trichonephila clavata]